MAADSSPEPDGEEKENEFVEVDPTGRFGRYNEMLGKGAFKTVYKAFDKGEGIEVAWNQVKRSNIPRYSDELDRVYSEVQLLKTLNHKNIIKFYNSWVDKQHDNINFITELFSSGTLRQYRKKHKNVDLRALKNWSRQILCGLIYLHSHDPPVIHRDLKCDNIFINGNQGEVKIGDLGLAAILHHAHSAHSVIGTPEFMAPELYEEEYNELVDIYAFGMCLLELVTFEYPYAECSNAAQIYKKVTSGIKPASLAKVNEPGIRQFIEKCIANVSERLSARELLKDPFLQMSSENGILCQTMPLYHNGSDSDAVRLEPSTSGIDCTVEGQRKDINTIFLKLRIADSSGQIHNIHFPFDIKADTSISVAAEMVAELDLTDQDVTTIADMIDTEIHVHFPGWAPVPLDEVHDNKSPSGKYFKTEHKFHTLPNDYQSFGNLAFERLPSGKKHLSGSPKGSSNAKQTQEFINIHDRDDVLEKEDTLKYSFHGVAPVNQEKESRHIIKCGCKNNGPNSPFFSSVVVQKHVKESTCPVSNEDELVTFSHNDSKRQLENGSNEFETVMLKLEKLLIKHQKEIDDLRKIHDIAIADLLRELPPELQSNAFSICCLKNQNEKVVRK